MELVDDLSTCSHDTLQLSQPDQDGAVIDSKSILKVVASSQSFREERMRMQPIDSSFIASKHVLGTGTSTSAARARYICTRASAARVGYTCISSTCWVHVHQQHVLGTRALAARIRYTCVSNSILVASRFSIDLYVLALQLWQPRCVLVPLDVELCSFVYTDTTQDEKLVDVLAALAEDVTDASDVSFQLSQLSQQLSQQAQQLEEQAQQLEEQDSLLSQVATL